MTALIAHGNLERDLGSGGGLLEDECDLLADQALLLGTRGSSRLQLSSEVEQCLELCPAEVGFLEEVASVKRH